MLSEVHEKAAQSSATYPDSPVSSSERGGNLLSPGLARASSGIDQRKLGRLNACVKISARVEEGNAKRGTIFAQSAAQGLARLKIPAHVVRARLI